MIKFSNISRNVAAVILGVLVVVATLPLVQVGLDWYDLYKYREDAQIGMESAPRGSDWIVWEDVDGQITATYVFDKGPGAEAGLQEGDQFVMLDFQPFFDAADLKNVISGIPPGETRGYQVIRDGHYQDALVTFTRHPTFLYPRSDALWRFALWGFTVGAFLHFLGLFIAAPLAANSRRALFEFTLIAVSSLWIVGNLARLLAIELFGPPDIGTAYDSVYQFLTLVGLLGWIGFPTLLLWKVAVDTSLVRTRRWLWGVFIFFLPVVLFGAVFTTTILDNIGQLSIEELLVPILFYASCYIGASALLTLLWGTALFPREEATDETPSESTTVEEVTRWGRTGSLLIVVIATAAALAVTGVLPILTSFGETATGWLIVSAQLLAVAPVTLFALGTLRYGKVDDVLTGAFVYALLLGMIFFAFVGGLSLMEDRLRSVGDSRLVLEGIFVVVLLIVFDRLARRVHLFTSSLFAGERRQARQNLARFQSSISDYLDVQVLVSRTIEVVGRVFDARSAVLYVKSPAGDGSWISGNYHPEPPYLTERVFRRIWPHFESHPELWASNQQLNENTAPPEVRLALANHNVALVVPIRGDGRPTGLIVLGPKSGRRSVYNLEDLDLLRSLSGQLALAVARLVLVEREKELAAESTEARLVALRAQINPHFLFNALNTILSLISERPEDAETVVEKLAAIFRYTLQAGSKPFVTMQEELTLVEDYLSIEQARFGENLGVTCEMDDSLKDHPVPAFAVQTIVENAIKHGLEKKRGGGRVEIHATASEEGVAVVRVSDTGIGIPALFGRPDGTREKESFFGIGLANVHDRLRQLFGREDLLWMSSSPEGTRVTLRLPAKRPENLATPRPAKILPPESGGDGRENVPAPLADTDSGNDRT